VDQIDIVGTERTFRIPELLHPEIILRMNLNLVQTLEEFLTGISPDHKMNITTERDPEMQLHLLQPNQVIEVQLLLQEVRPEVQ
jgi:hypothetical protein